MLEFLKRKRAIVERARHPETVRHQHLLARAIAVVHAPNLWDSLVAFVDQHDRVTGKIIE